MNNNYKWGRKGLTTTLTILFFGICTASFGQSKTVSGIISDSDGEGLPGVTVQVKKTQAGTITDIDGKYSLAVSENDVLIISYIGFVTQEVVVGNRTVIDISLSTDVQELSEVVVIGYGKVEQGDVTGVVNKIDAKDFNKGMLTSPDQLLAGKVAGVQITPASGEPGGGISIRMRGGTSLSAGNEPLFVIDGVPLENDGVAGGRNPLNFINPGDIADITVLKDASSAAIYGSRGANGVIIITTKSGTSGKPEFSYSGSYSVSSIVDRVRMLDTDEFAFTVGRKGPKNLGDLGNSDTDWLDEVLQTAQGHNHNLSSSFGGKTNSMRVAVNYQNLNGILLTSNTERFSGSINFTQRLLDDDLTINVNTKHSLINNRFAPNVVGSALVFDPTQSVFADDPETGGYFEWSSNLAPGNPVAQINQTLNIGKTVRHLVAVAAEYKLPFVEGLSAKVNYAVDDASGLSQVTSLINPKAGRVNGGFSYFEDTRKSNLLEAYLNYTKTLSIGKLDLVGGYSYQDFTTQVQNTFNLEDGFSLDTLGISNPSTFISDGKLAEIEPLLFNPIPRNLENRLISFWGRANLSIDDKYLITATVRKDGSTRFAPENQWGLFPSLAVGWRVIEESFASGIQSVLSDLKVRASWGITGNEEIGDYLYVNLYEPGDNRAQYIFGQDTVNTFRPNAVDPLIKWEETQSLNFGVDFGLLEGRLTGSIDLYKKNTTDLLFNIAFPIGTLTGDRAVTNIGEVENKGVELLLNSVVLDKSVKVNVAFNAAYNKNEIIKLDNSNLPSFQGYTTGGISGDVGQSVQILKVGLPVNSFFVYEHKRDANGNPIPDGEDANGDGLRDNLDMYVDQLTVDTNDDGIPDAADGQINEDDLRPFQKPAPDLIMGLTTNVSFKKFDLAMTLRSQLGGYVYNNVQSQFGAFEGVDNNFAPNNIHLSAYDNNFTEKQLLSDIFIERASFLKLDNISVGYSFKEAENMRVRAYLTASNLLTISGYSGIDPEAGISGIDNNQYPRSRTFVLGVNLTLK